MISAIAKRLRSLFGSPPRRTPPPIGPVIHIHEDDWGMRNLYPAVAEAEVLGDMAASEANSRENFDGLGWSKMHEIKAPSVTFGDLNLSAPDVEAALSPLMPRVRRFYATITSHLPRTEAPLEERDPYGSYEENALCFGFGADCFIKIDLRDGRVGAIWFQADSPVGPELAVLTRGLMALEALTPCLVADYWLSAVGRLSDKRFAERYFAALAGADEVEP